jgi:uncharacterized membrane protein
MVSATQFPMTHQGVRDLDNPICGSRDVNVGKVERAVSTLGGAILAGYGVGKGNLVGLVLAAVGGSLIYRGVTGHCSAYQLAGINTTCGE